MSSSAIAKGHVHFQDVAAKTWVITHGLFDANVAVEVYVMINAALVKIIPNKVTSTTTSVTVQFSTAYTGRAMVV